MRFPFREIHQFIDAQRNFEYLESHGQFDSTPAGGALKGTYPNPTFAVPISYGIFTTGTGTINSAGSGDWSLSALGTGVATVTFTTRAAAPAVLATFDVGAFTGWAQVTTIGVSSAIIQTLNSAGPALANGIVSFMVMGA